MSMQRTKPSAFTLVELMVALTIASVLTAIALPTLKDSMRQNALSRSASVVKGAFINARAQAIRTGRPYGLVIERRRKRIGQGNASDLDLLTANYATRMYYVQSSIEYRGDSNNAQGYPVYINPDPVEGPSQDTTPTGTTPPLVPAFFFPQSSAGVLYAAANGNLAASRLLSLGTKFSFANSGYVYETRIDSVTGGLGRTGTAATLLGTFASQLPVPGTTEGTLIFFDHRAFSPTHSNTSGVYTINANTCRFPSGLSPFQGYSFKFQSNPVRAPFAPVNLIGRSVIDLSISGTSIDPIAFNAQSIVDSNPAAAVPTLNPDVLMNDILVMFSPEGQLDGIYFDRRVDNGLAITRFDALRLDPATTVAFNVGFVDGILANIDDGARFPEPVPGTNYQINGGDVAFEAPAPPGAVDLDKVPNFANPDCAWVTIHPLSGAVSLDTVATQPSLAKLSAYYGYQPAANSQTARRVVRDRILQSRRLATGGTVQ